MYYTDFGGQTYYECSNDNVPGLSKNVPIDSLIPMPPNALLDDIAEGHHHDTPHADDDDDHDLSDNDDHHHESDDDDHHEPFETKKKPVGDKPPTQRASGSYLPSSHYRFSGEGAGVGTNPVNKKYSRTRMLLPYRRSGDYEEYSPDDFNYEVANQRSRNRERMPGMGREGYPYPESNGYYNPQLDWSNWSEYGSRQGGDYDMDKNGGGWGDKGESSYPAAADNMLPALHRTNPHSPPSDSGAWLHNTPSAPHNPAAKIASHVPKKSTPGKPKVITNPQMQPPKPVTESVNSPSDTIHRGMACQQA